MPTLVVGAKVIWLTSPENYMKFRRGILQMNEVGTASMKGEKWFRSGKKKKKMSVIFFLIEIEINNCWCGIPLFILIGGILVPSYCFTHSTCMIKISTPLLHLCSECFPQFVVLILLTVFCSIKVVLLWFQSHGAFKFDFIVLFLESLFPFQYLVNIHGYIFLFLI